MGRLLFALVGGALQAATQSSNFILIARVVTGLGTGALTGITPVLVSETSPASHRGGFLGYVFIANYLGISIVNLVAASLYEASRSQLQNAPKFAPAAVAMLFLSNLVYASTWGTVVFLVPIEIWSSDMRA